MDTENQLGVLVIQMGARRGYEVPRMLQEKGVLSSFYTDAAWPADARTPDVLIRLFPRLAPALRRRQVVGIPSSKLHASLLPNFLGWILGRTKIDPELKFRYEDWALGYGIRHPKKPDANVVFSVAGNGGNTFLRKAKRRGLKVATDVIITPLVYDILKEERLRWPHWAPENEIRADSKRYRQYLAELFQISDLIIAPSNFVADGVIEIAPDCKQRLTVVPYALGAMPIRKGNPVAGRVLFAGDPSLRKGLPYLGIAAQTLKTINPDIEVRVAGRAPQHVRSQPECKALNFLGHLSPEEMASEFQTADVFVLPSLAEGMAGVSLEALANGLPCVVTKESGAPIATGVNGVVIESRSPKAITHAISQIVSDRIYREQLSKGALTSAEDHILPRISDKLVEKLRGLINGA